jgi:hypothetical protein
MTRWALVRNGYVLSVFEGDDDPRVYPDIQDFLVVVDDTVSDNMVKQEDGSYAYPPPLSPEKQSLLIEKLGTLTATELDKLVTLSKAL